MRILLPDSSAPVTARPPCRAAERGEADATAVICSENAKALIKIRNWANANLPVYGSLICYDLALHVLAVDGASPAGLKQLYGTLPYSEAHLRRHLRRLERDEWISLKQHPADARNRSIEPTAKMLNAYRDYFLLYVTPAAAGVGGFSR